MVQPHDAVALPSHISVNDEPLSLTAGLRVLVIDDEKNIRTTLAVCLESMGCMVTCAGSATAALEAIEREPFDLAFLDLRLHAESGMDLLPKLLAIRTHLAIVIMTAYATFDTAVEAIKRGATDYLPKPFSPPQIRHVIERIADQRAMMHQLQHLQGTLADEVPEIDLLTHASQMQSALALVARAAHADAPVLFYGESGTGKTVLARSLHQQSMRHAHPFVTVNCPTLSEELLASELFGHAKGSFTGAVRDQEGRVESAEGGTLFLDEVSEISPTLQAKLLRFVQSKEFERVGENRTRRANVRIIAATNRRIEAEVAQGRFRNDLYFRLNVLEITVPPLRDRSEDILHMAHHFLNFFAKAARRPVPELSPGAIAALLNYSWPGNIRELRNAIERALIVWPGHIIEAEAFPERIATHTVNLPRLGGDFTLERLEQEHIVRILKRAPTLDDAAHILGIDTATLWRKRKKFDI